MLVITSNSQGPAGSDIFHRHIFSITVNLNVDVHAIIVCGLSQIRALGKMEVGNGTPLTLVLLNSTVLAPLYIKRTVFGTLYG